MKTRELMQAFATVTRAVPGRYARLEAALAEAPVDAQQEFQRLVQSFDQELTTARRRAREPWRR